MDWEYDDPSPPSRAQGTRPESARGLTGRALLPAFTPSGFVFNGSVIPGSDDTLPDVMDSDYEPSSASTIKNEEKSTIRSRNKVMSKTPEPEAPPHMNPRVRELEKYRIELEVALASNEALLAALARRANEPPRSFVADGTIRLLPEWCGINLTATAFTPGGRVPEIQPFELPRPELTILARPTELVGKVKASFDSDTYRETNPFRSADQFVAHEGGWQLPGRHLPGPEPAFVPKIVVDPPTPTAGQDVYLRPKFVSPFFDLITKEGEDELPVSMHDVELTEKADTEYKRLGILAGMLGKWEWELEVTFTTFKVQAMNWRTARCKWELETLREVFFSGNLAMLPADFGIHSLIRARLCIEERSDRERRGEIEEYEHICEPQVCQDYLDFLARVKKTAYEVKYTLYILGTERGAERERQKDMGGYLALP